MKGQEGKRRINPTKTLKKIVNRTLFRLDISWYDNMRIKVQIVCFALILILGPSLYLFAVSPVAFRKFIEPLNHRLENGHSVAIAVIDVETPEKPSAEIEDLFMQSLSKYEMFSLIDRSRWLYLLREQKYNLSGLIEESNAPEIGKMLGATHVCFIEVDSLRIIAVETGEIISIHKFTTASALPSPKNVEIDSPKINMKLAMGIGLGFGGAEYIITYPDGTDTDFSFAMLVTGGIGISLFSWLNAEFLAGYCLDHVYYYDPNSLTYSSGKSYPHSGRNGGGTLYGLRTIMLIKKPLNVVLELGILQTESVFTSGGYIGIGIAFGSYGTVWGFVLSPTKNGFVLSSIIDTQL